MTFFSIDTLVIFIYAAVVLGMGILLSRKQTSAEEYFVGSRRMNWLIVGISIQATLLSTISYLSVPGEQIKDKVITMATANNIFFITLPP